MSFNKLFIIKNIAKHNGLLFFCCMFLFGSFLRAQDNNETIFYVGDKALITGEDQIFISSKLNSNQQKVYVDANTVFYESGIVSMNVEYINNIQKNISKDTNKQLNLTHNSKGKKLKEKVNKVICFNSNSDNFPFGRKKINILFSAASSITYSNSSKKVNIENISILNLFNPIVLQYSKKYNFRNYDKVINCFKINSKLYNRPPPQNI